MSSRTRYWLCTKCKEISTVIDPNGKAEAPDEVRCHASKSNSYCTHIELVPKKVAK